MGELQTMSREEIRHYARRLALGSSLAPRELAVLRLVAQGATNPEIAARLHVSVATVKEYLNRACVKLGATGGRANVVAVAYELGVLRPGDAREVPGG